MPNLTEINSSEYTFNCSAVDEIICPKLTTLSGNYHVMNSPRYIKFPQLHEGYILYSDANLKTKTIILGDGSKDGVAGNIQILKGATNTYLTTLTVAEGFKANLNLTGCNGLERDVLLGIINNLADLKGTEYEDKLQLTLGSTLYGRLNDDDRKIATDKGWKVTG